MKRWLLILTAIIAIGCTCMAYFAYNYYAPPTERIAYQTKQHQDDTVRIAYIGDSWAAMHKEHNCIIAQIFSDSIHRPVKVSSYGLPGKTSKEIYESLFDNQMFRSFMTEGYDFCFISAGINDTYKKMSTDYYQKSMDNILRLLLANNIRPIILEIPDYDIIKAYNRQRTERKLIRQASMLITGTQVKCKQDFRKALLELISQKYNPHQINIIKFREWNNNYPNDLQRYYINDGMHLNQQGYARLDSCIVKHIITSSKNIIRWP